MCFSVESSDAATDFPTSATANIYEQPAEQLQVSTAYMGITIVKMCFNASLSALCFIKGRVCILF
jgi:hypothetical protein